MEKLQSASNMTLSLEMQALGAYRFHCISVEEC